MSNKIPYTEIIARIKLDINYIVEEAYRNGYDEARLIYQNPHAEADYQRGQEDMHKAIFQMVDMNSADRMDAFGMVNTYDIITNLSPSEFYAKLTAYEVKKKEDSKIIEPIADLNENIKELAQEAGRMLRELYEAIEKMKGGE